jgi:hypothetical protein
MEERKTQAASDDDLMVVLLRNIAGDKTDL